MGLVAAGLILPSTAVAFGNSALAEVKVKTNNVEAITRSDGSIYVDTGGTTLNVPQRDPRRYWNPFRYWSFPWQSLDNRSSDRQCRQSSYQSTHQTTQSGTVQHSSYSHSCD